MAKAAPKLRRSGCGTPPCGTRSWLRGARCPGSQRQRDEEGERDRGVRLGEARPQHHEHEDQPDMVRLPDRGDGVVDDLTRPFATLRAPPATRSQKPAPKSAPPKIAYIRIAANRMMGGRGAHPMALSLRRRPRSVGSLGPYGTSSSVRSPSPEPAAHAAQDEDGRDTEPDVEEHDADERDPDPRVRGGGVLDLHLLVDDPGLTSDLADDPARFHGDDGEHPGGGGGPKEPLAPGHVPSEDPRGPPYHSVSRNSSVPSPTITSHARWVTLTLLLVGRSSAGTLSSPWMTVDVPLPGRTGSRPSPGSGGHRPPSPVGVEVAEQHLGHVTAVSVTISIAANFTAARCRPSEPVSRRLPSEPASRSPRR